MLDGSSKPLCWLLICPLFAFAGQLGRGGVYSIGVTLEKHDQNCALIVWNVFAHSPAALAGIKAGDEITRINGKDASLFTVKEASAAIRSTQRGEVLLTLRHKNGRQYTRHIQRAAGEDILQANGLKDSFGALVPIETTDIEVKNMITFDGGRIIGRIFPLHYPTNVAAFYPGFEIFGLREPKQFMVGGIEASSAARAGIHWGDLLIQVNGVALDGKTEQELEALFLRKDPVTLRLTIERSGSRKTVEFPLEQVSAVLAENHRKLVDDHLVPDSISDKDLSCFAHSGESEQRFR
jgi:hypothetical protein